MFESNSVEMTQLECRSCLSIGDNPINLFSSYRDEFDLPFIIFSCTEILVRARSAVNRPLKLTILIDFCRSPRTMRFQRGSANVVRIHGLIFRNSGKCLFRPMRD